MTAKPSGQKAPRVPADNTDENRAPGDEVASVDGYQTPRLIRFGTLIELTQSGNRRNGEVGSIGSRKAVAQS